MGTTMGKSKPPKTDYPTSENLPPIKELFNKDSKKKNRNSRVLNNLCRACGGTGKLITYLDLDVTDAALVPDES